MCLVKAALKIAMPVPNIEKFERYLVIGPHPDDIEIGMGATVAKLVAQDKDVAFLIVTDGRYGASDEKVNPLELIKTRKNEAIKAAGRLGVTNVSFLGYSDGGFYEVDKVREDIARAIARYKPDVIFAPDYKLFSEHHADHINVGRATANAFILCGNAHIMKKLGEDCFATPKAIAYYFSEKPNKIVKISRKQNEAKLEAIRLHESQFTDEEYKMLCLYLKLRSLALGGRRLTLRAEGFRVLGAIHTHCAVV